MHAVEGSYYPQLLRRIIQDIMSKAAVESWTQADHIAKP